MSKNNTLTRVLVSIVAIPLILFLCIKGEYYFLFFALLIGTLAYHEFTLLATKKNAAPQIINGILITSVIIVNAFFKFLPVEEILLISILYLLIVELFRNRGSALMNLGMTILGIMYISFFTSSLVEIREFFSNYENGGKLIITLLASIWICDSAAFFIGIPFGKHRLFLRVSPKKSWEGAIGGFVFAIAALFLSKNIYADFLTTTDAIVIGIIVGVIGQVGDLIESLLKRDAEVKDSSALIPGHGGVFDRFDSLIFVAPVVYLYLFLFMSR